ncbi:hypothetical protein ABEB36_015567 [Hypothenemus hampei]|uniref:Uncharacterized protein n=1 Tax=Hypothenemus hampei TaxID=57062 RepID=A0ABD1DZI7_HYPHA
MKTHQKVNDKDIDEIKSQRETENLMQRKSRKCPLCSFTNIEMLSLQEFNEWKKSVESNSNSKFVIENNENYKEKKITSYVCHRSGNYIPEAVRHSNDAVSVDAFVHQMRTDGDVILFYKPQGEILEYKPQLKRKTLF